MIYYIFVIIYFQHYTMYLQLVYNNLKVKYISALINFVSSEPKGWNIT